MYMVNAAVPRLAVLREKSTWVDIWRMYGDSRALEVR